MAHLIDDGEPVPVGVKAALIGLGADLGTAEKAAGGNPKSHWLLVKRALNSYAAHLSVAGYQQVGTDLVKTADTDLAKQVSPLLADLEKRLERLENTAVPGGPALRRPQVVAPPARTEADVYREKALAASDPQLRAAYLSLAREKESGQ